MVRFIQKRVPQFVPVIKFGLVGVTCMVIDFGIVFLLYEMMHLNQYFANVISTSIAVIVNYLLNRNWTFRSKNPWKKEFVKFLTIGTIGLSLNNFIVFISHDVWLRLLNFWCLKNTPFTLFQLCTDKIKWSFYLSKLWAIFLVFFWNYYINKKYNFNTSKAA